MNLYEGMFLFDPTFGSSFENCEAEVRRLMERAQGEIVICRKWDERRLAYRIQGRKRGIYVLVYFNAPAEMITPLQRDVELSEDVLRLLVLRADGLTADDMENAFKIAHEESSRSDEHPYRGDSPGRPERSDRPRRTDAAPDSAAKKPEAAVAQTTDAPKKEESTTSD